VDQEETTTAVRGVVTLALIMAVVLAEPLEDPVAAAVALEDTMETAVMEVITLKQAALVLAAAVAVRQDVILKVTTEHTVVVA
jgi:hypothetical protein